MGHPFGTWPTRECLTCPWIEQRRQELAQQWSNWGMWKRHRDRIVRLRHNRPRSGLESFDPGVARGRISVADTDGLIQLDETDRAAGPHGKQPATEHRPSTLDRYTVAADTEVARTALAHMATAQAANARGAKEEETES